MGYRLRRCPFCGGKASLIECRAYIAEGYRVHCTGCKVSTSGVYIDRPQLSCDGPIETTRYTREQAAEVAVNIWNRRVRR